MAEEKVRAGWCNRNILTDHELLFKSLKIFKVMGGSLLNNYRCTAFIENKIG